MTYYTNDNGDIAKIIERNFTDDLIKIVVNDKFIDEWQKYSDFIVEFKRMGAKDEPKSNTGR